MELRLGGITGPNGEVFPFFSFAVYSVTLLLSEVPPTAIPRLNVMLCHFSSPSFVSLGNLSSAIKVKIF